MIRARPPPSRPAAHACQSELSDVVSVSPPLPIGSGRAGQGTAPCFVLLERTAYARISANLNQRKLLVSVGGVGGARGGRGGERRGEEGRGSERRLGTREVGRGSVRSSRTNKGRAEQSGAQQAR